MNAPAALEQARSYLQQRNYPAALECCQHALLHDPSRSDAHELLGLTLVALGQVAQGISHLRQAVRHPAGDPASIMNLADALRSHGQPEESIKVLRQALACGGHSPQLLYSLALAQQARGDWSGAIESYRRCVQLDPVFAKARNNLGTALYQLGRTEEAIESFRAALAAEPDYVRALVNLGNALRKAKQFAEAEKSLNRALELAAEYPPALCNLAQLRLDEKRPAEARELYTRALARDPRRAEAHFGLGTALYLCHDYPLALASLDQAIALSPDRAEGHVYRGRVLERLDRFTEAVASYDRALQLQPEAADTWVCRGVALGSVGRFHEAIESYERALRITPDLVAARWNQALLRLLMGDFEVGWKLFETRFELTPAPHDPRAISCPAWRGETSLEGKRIWVRPEPGDGFGDTIQFCRYVKLLEARGARVIFEVRASLRSLMSTLSPRLELIALGDPVASADCQCTLMSLPMAFCTHAPSIPAERGYLKAEPQRVAAWTQRIGTEGLRVGIAWQGHERWQLKGRSMRLEQFAPLAVVPGARFVSLQKGTGTEQLAEVSFRERIRSFGDALDEGPDAFLDTAAVMMNLDLVITVDTSIAHLAGALGVPVWVALKTPTDWRWHLDREDSPWYPTMRLFRQRAPGDWAPVMEAMAAELGRLSQQPLLAPGAGAQVLAARAAL